MWYPRRYPDSGKERSPFIIMSIISLDSDTFIMVSLLALYVFSTVILSDLDSLVLYPPLSLLYWGILSLVLYLSWLYHYISWWFSSLTYVIFYIPNCHRGFSFYVFFYWVMMYEKVLVGLFCWKVLISESFLLSAYLLL